SLKWTRAQLNGGRLTRQRRKASAWNAFVSAKLNKANETRAPGKRYRLPAYISAHYAQLQQTYACLSESEKKKLQLGIDDLRTMRVNIVRSNPKALLKDVNSTFNTMEKEHFHEAKVFLTAKAKSFIKDVLHFEPKHLALKFDVVLCYGLMRGADSILQENNLASKKVQMNYENYEKNIIEVYGVAING
ncbi:hypothetical protein F4604DRAFT_1548900, partial [Suillus subluteus]